MASRGGEILSTHVFSFSCQRHESESAFSAETSIRRVVMIGMTFWQYGVSVPEVLIYLYISERFEYLPTYALHVWPGICII